MIYWANRRLLGWGSYISNRFAQVFTSIFYGSFSMSWELLVTKVSCVDTSHIIRFTVETDSSVQIRSSGYYVRHSGLHKAFFTVLTTNWDVRTWLTWWWEKKQLPKRYKVIALKTMHNVSTMLMSSSTAVTNLFELIIQALIDWLFVGRNSCPWFHRFFPDFFRRGFCVDILYCTNRNNVRWVDFTLSIEA